MTFTLRHCQVEPPRVRLLADLQRGLSQPQPEIPPKWFYDEHGSELFEKITRLDEYYPTEAERRLLGTHVEAIVEGRNFDVLVELGAGVSDKTTVLLDALATTSDAQLGFVPFDISPDAIQAGAHRLLDQYPGIQIQGVVGDLDAHLSELPTLGNRLIALLGGTIGNYRTNPRQHLLARIAETMAINDCLLLGTDLVKNEDRLINAYDDQAGVTAAFNKNVLAVINRTLGLAIDPDSFEHRAQWNRLHEHIEMHLVAIEPVNLPIPGASLQLDPGDHLLTETSAKFTSERLSADLKAAGLRLTDSWTDGDYLISLSQRT